jgi:hypothetical protein
MAKPQNESGARLWAGRIKFVTRSACFMETKQLRAGLFILVSYVAKPDFRWQQGWIPAAASAAKPQGNHADFIVGTGRPWPDPIRIRK